LIIFGYFINKQKLDNVIIYITSSRVAELNVSGEHVHQQLWPLFQQLLSSALSSSSATTSHWKYAHSFNYAVDSVSHEYKITKNEGLSTSRMLLIHNVYSSLTNIKTIQLNILHNDGRI
jgi:hypothetical protein